MHEFSCPDFPLDKNQKISSLFYKEKVYTFHAALKYVHKLLYKRISNLEDLTLVLIEKRGTCSSKHGLLAQLAEENGYSHIEVKLGYFKFFSRTLPELKEKFNAIGADYIIEAHCYLSYKGSFIDVTSCQFDARQLLNPKNLLEEVTIKASQTGKVKQAMHKKYFENWCTKYSIDFEKAWSLRCAVIDCLVQKAENV
ncbi:MAG: hypothetical protein S4CHLAM6_13080 [Chlamydiae bacterium]|nr:hypothetical protein [Chlamydiota bacterium]